MNAERIDAVWMEEHHLFSIDELDERWGLSRGQIDEFIATGVLEPAASPAGERGFRLDAVSLLRTACRLQQDLELDAHAVGVVLQLLGRIQALEEQLAGLRSVLAPEPRGQDVPAAAEFWPRGRS